MSRPPPATDRSRPMRYPMLPVLIVYFFAQEKLIGGIANVGIKG